MIDDLPTETLDPPAEIPQSPPAASDDDRARLAKLRDLVVLDTPPEPLFDSLTQMASEVCGMPIALLSLVDEQRQWFKSNVGLPGVNETPRDIAFCAHAIASDATLEIGDASVDERFKDNALVTGGPEIRFYAGAPLILWRLAAPTARMQPCSTSRHLTTPLSGRPPPSFACTLSPLMSNVRCHKDARR